MSASVSLLLAACGQRGPLYLPKIPETPADATPANPADPAKPVKQSAEPEDGTSRDTAPPSSN